MSNLFGGSQSKNEAYSSLASPLNTQVQTGTSANTQIANLLGLNGAQGQNQGFQDFQNSTGYQFGLNQGIQSINGNAATQGLLNSGGNEKALETYGQNYADTQYGQYTGLLQGLNNTGNQAAGAQASAGQQNTTNPNILGSLFGNGGISQAAGAAFNPAGGIASFFSGH